MKTNMLNEATNSVLWDYDIERHVLLTYSDKALMPHQPITLERYLEYVHPKDKELVKEYFAKADNRILDDFNFEIDLMIPEHNEYRRISANGVAVKDEQGRIVKYTGVRRDISDITELNRMLADQNRLKETVVENIFVGLILLSTDYKIVWANEYAATSFHDMIDYDSCRPGMKCENVVKHICTKHQGRCIIKKAIETGEIQREERRYGNDRFVEITAIPVINEFRQCTGALLKLRDFTEHRRMLREMKEAKERAIEASDFVSTLMDKMPSPIFIVEPNDDYRIQKVNDAFCKVFDTDKSMIIGKTNAELFGKDVAEKYKSYDIMLAGGRPDSSVTYNATLNIDNQEKTWAIHKSMIEINGKKPILAISSDITELKKMNIELEAAKDKALSADRLKSAFLANMSHEIRTPLNAIVGFSQLLSETDDKEEKEEFSKIINSNNQMLLRLVGDILDLSKIEAGTTEFSRDLVEVSSYFNELTASLAMKVTNPDVKFIVDNPYKTCYINMDRLRFGQVVTNFVTNAIKYTQKGFVKVGYHIERHGVTIKVQDTGMGIPANKRARVFTRFDKLDSMVQGTGLGLSIAKVLTETGGGKIWFESEEGKGSTFFSWKPFTDIRVLEADENGVSNENEPITNIPELSESTEVHEPKASHHLIRRILVAEDNPSNYRLLQKILVGYEIDWAKDGVEAVDKVAKQRYDIVLMDIKMPIMDGLDATRQIRKFNPAIPIVAVTANAYAIDKDEALLAGCNDFIAKPILKEDIYNVLAKI